RPREGSPGRALSRDSRRSGYRRCGESQAGQIEIRSQKAEIVGTYAAKKKTGQGIFYQAMDKWRERTSDDPLKALKKAVENAKPLLEVKTRRVGGANYQVPIEVPQNRRTSLAIRWIITNARTRPEKGMAEKLANELNDASNMRGGAIKKKDDVHRMAEANKAFAHYRW